jgi:hypothetical protein
MRNNQYNSVSKRIKFNKEKRNEFLIKFNHCCCMCNCSVSNEYHLDHIKPLARGGTNHEDNIQNKMGPNEENFILPDVSKKDHSIPLEHLDFKYVDKCENIKELEKIYKILA